MKFTRMRESCLVLQGGGARYPAITFLRGFSIFTIVLMHLVQNYFGQLPVLLYQAAAVGGTGAHVFLFCSGFGLYYAHLRRPLTPVQFLRRRLGRVYLPYLPVVLASACVPALCVGVDRIEALLSHVFLYKMFFPRYMESFGMQFWFVSTIFQFYLLFIPLCRLRERLGSMRRLVLIGFGVSAVWWILLTLTAQYEERVLNSFCAQFLWEFVLGMAVAEYLHRGKTIRLRPLWLCGVAVAGLGIQAVIGLWGGYPLRLFNDIPALFGYGALALLLFHFGKGVLDRLFCALSHIAYAWYLWHILVFTLVFSRCPDGAATKIGFGMLAFLLSLAVAWGYTALIAFVQRRLARKST